MRSAVTSASVRPLVHRCRQYAFGRPASPSDAKFAAASCTRDGFNLYSSCPIAALMFRQLRLNIGAVLIERAPLAACSRARMSQAYGDLNSYGSPDCPRAFLTRSAGDMASQLRLRQAAILLKHRVSVRFRNRIVGEALVRNVELGTPAMQIRCRDEVCVPMKNGVWSSPCFWMSTKTLWRRCEFGTRANAMVEKLRIPFVHF